MAVSKYDEQYLSDEQQRQLRSLEAAAQAGSMSWDDAHNLAEGIRATAGYSGGAWGDKFQALPKWQGENKAPDTPTAQPYAASSAVPTAKPLSYYSAVPTVQQAIVSQLPVPEGYGGSKWDSAADQLAQAAMGMKYEDWAKTADYSALADRYAKQGENAMKNTIGEISARTGGLASSYAATAAEQQYNQYMVALEEAARGQYENERAKLFENASLAGNMANDAYNRWAADRNFNYAAYLDNVNIQNQQRTDELERAQLAAGYGDYAGLKALGITPKEETDYTKALPVPRGVQGSDAPGASVPYVITDDDIKALGIELGRKDNLTEDQWQKALSMPKGNGGEVWTEADLLRAGFSKASRETLDKWYTDAKNIAIQMLLKNGDSKQKVIEMLKDTLNSGYIDSAGYKKLYDYVLQTRS